MIEKTLKKLKLYYDVFNDHTIISRPVVVMSERTIEAYGDYIITTVLNIDEKIVKEHFIYFPIDSQEVGTARIYVSNKLKDGEVEVH
jgi:hypothetical protein